MKKICYIQPIVANYSVPLFSELGRHWQLIVIYSPARITQGYDNDATANMNGVDSREISMIRPFGNKIGMYQVGIIRQLRKLRPDAVIIFANMRYLSFWTTIFWCKVNGIPVFPRGHGVYRKDSPGLFWKITYQVLLSVCTAYICYTPSVAASLRRLGLPAKKIAVAENSLDNPHSVKPDEKTNAEHGILYIGRLRPGCRLGLLINSVKRLRDMGQSKVTLHIIGDGIESKRIRLLASEMPWVHFYGSVYEPERIKNISNCCMVGCYPGNAGLSIVHFMSLSLPPIVHDDMAAHGPEPSYIKSGENGLLFDHLNPEAGLLSALIYMLEEPKELKRMQAKAYATYEQIAKPSLAMRIINIVGE